MILGDAGSSWCKVFAVDDDAVQIVPTRAMVRDDARFDWGTGHTARRRSTSFENDLIALSRGALELVDEDDFTVLDLGSRDAKLVGFDGRRPTKLDWSVGCAAATGATLEMLGRFYELDLDAVPAVDEWTSVTCGTYAIEKIMDALNDGEPVEQAVGRFVHGLARNAFAFTGKPERLFLSGGFTLNQPFLTALGRYTEVVPLGRTAPLCGLWAFAADADPAIGPLPAPLRESTSMNVTDGST
ncbi:MAG: ATPase [Deltaproteobacteria bacterium]|nr:ATPase [Deltaproteobacteria bacterium]